MNEEWYLVYNNQQIGPMSAQQLLSYNINPDTLVWRKGMTEWAPVYTLPELMQLINNRGPVPPSARPTYNPGSGASGGPGCPPVPPYGQPGVNSGKDKIAAGLLAIFLGGLGIQYFYVGKTTGGLLTILLSFVTCGIWSFLMLVQGILMITMTQAEFDRKYVYNTTTLPLF